MKKQLMAAMALLATGGAWAQSSVTLFGGMDLGYTRGSGSIAHKNALTSGNNYTSRLGLRVREDLGGGTYAGVYLEAQLNGDDGNGVPSNSNNQASGAGTSPSGLTFNRGAYVNLGNSQWGEIRLGRDYTSYYRNRTEFDPFTNVGVGTNQAQSSSIAGITGVRASNEISYWTPATLGGFYAVANYFFGENASNAANHGDGSGSSLRLGYKNGPWHVAVAGGATQYTRTATTGDVRVLNAGAAYNFGVVNLMGGYYRDRSERTSVLNGKGYIIGAVAPVFGTDQLRLSVSRYETDAAGNPATRKIAAGYVHSLSKRSAVYATYARVNNRGGAAFALGGSATAPNHSSSGLDIGLRHIF